MLEARSQRARAKYVVFPTICNARVHDPSVPNTVVASLSKVAMLASLILKWRYNRVRYAWIVHACYISSEKLHILHVHVASGLRACGCRTSTVQSGCWHDDADQQLPPTYTWVGDASVAKFHTETYNCVRYAWIVHARDTYRRKIGMLCACTVRAGFEHVDIVRA